MGVFSHICLACLWYIALYHRASLNYGEDAAEDPRTDEQLPLLAQIQVDVMQNDRQQNTTRLWGRGKERRKEWMYVWRFWYLQEKKTQISAFVSPGKKKRRLSTVRAMDCSLTTSMDWPMSTVLGMLPKVPLTYSATSWTVNICSSSSKISGKLFNNAAWGDKPRTGRRNL